MSLKETAAGGIVYRQQGSDIQILVIEDQYGIWTIPKGKQEPGETLEKTALREIEEETGIKGQIVRPVDRVYYRYKHPDRGLVDKEVKYYLVRATGGTLTPQIEEIHRVAWLELHEALEKLRERGYANNYPLLKKAKRMLNRLNGRPLASYIDHTLLKADATAEDIARLCQEAKENHFAAVCVLPTWVRLCTQLLSGTPVKVCTVIGFPLGANTPQVKALETRTAIEDGATEVDMVLNIGALKDGNLALALEDIRSVVEEAHGKALVKVIIETALLTEDEKVTACQLIERAGAHFVKTSTGFAASGATVEDVRLLRQTVGERIGVKASGGIRTRKAAELLLEAGATRLGTSAGVQLVESEMSC